MVTTRGIGVHDQNLETQIEKHMSGGCMAGFFNLFDRSPLLPAKRLPLPLPLPLPSSFDVADSSSELGSPAPSRELKKPQIQRSSQSSPKSELRSLAADPVIRDPPKSPLAVSTFEFKESVKSPWKFTRETPRLSLDSRAVVDAKGGLHPREIRINTCSGSGDDEKESRQHRSPSVIARLMGLEPARVLTNSTTSVSEVEKKVELRRSASESRSRECNYKFFDAAAPSFLSSTVKTEMAVERKSDFRNPNYIGNAVKCNNLKVKNQNQDQNHDNQRRRLMVERKSYYDTADFFPPEVLPAKYQHHQAVTIYGEIERRLRMRGIDEPSKDLETLKHILEALQLKGLLHHSSATNANANANVKHHQNVVLDRRFSQHENVGESPIIVMKPARTQTQIPSLGSLSSRRSVEPSVSPRRERPTRGRAENNRSSSPGVRRNGGPLSVETQRRGVETMTTTTTPRSLRSPAQSPKKTRRSSDHNQTVNRSPRRGRSTAEITQDERRLHSTCGPVSPEDEASTISESSYSTSSHTDNERWRTEEYRDGRNLLERCDKLLHSIAEMNSTSNSSSAELQKPSPVSVLDSSFYKDDESSPSPVKKRAIDFKDAVLMELEDEQWSPPSSTSQLLPKYPRLHLHLGHGNRLDVDSSDGSDFSYVSEVLRASMYLPDETDLFLLLEKQNSIRNRNKDDNSKASILQRKLVFDTITEILGRARELPPWKAVLSPGRPTMSQIWAEFLKIQERGPAEDLLEVICGVLKKDLAGDSVNGWGDCHVEMSEAVLDIERMIFKDLICETIQDLAGKSVGDQAPRRKLVF